MGSSVLERAWRRPAVALAAALGLLAAPAGAQPSPSDDAFLQAKALMQQGRTAEACQKFQESMALEARGGTLLNLAVCREKEGRYATALRLLHEARERAAKDGRADREALADERIQRVEGLVSWLTVRVAPGADAPDLTVQCDGEDVPRESWGKLRAVDPGSHTVTAVAAGRARFEATVQIGAARDAQVVEIPPPAAPPEARPVHVEGVASIRPPDTPLPPVAPPPPPRPTPGPAPIPWTTPVGWVAVGLGTAALVTGAGFGIRAIVDVHESAPFCPKGPDGIGACTTMTAYAESQDAPRAARVADVTLPLGLVTAAVGLYLILRPRPSTASAPAAALRLGVTAEGGPRFSLGGAF